MVPLKNLGAHHRRRLAASVVPSSTACVVGCACGVRPTSTTTPTPAAASCRAVSTRRDDLPPSVKQRQRSRPKLSAAREGGSPRRVSGTSRRTPEAESGTRPGTCSGRGERPPAPQASCRQPPLRRPSARKSGRARLAGVPGCSRRSAPNHAPRSRRSRATRPPKTPRPKRRPCAPRGTRRAFADQRAEGGGTTR
jgi:hypothetical protein